MWRSLRSLGVFSAQAERRYARKASAELLVLFHAVREQHPQLSGRTLYQAVIAQRLRSDDRKAAERVLRAEESFADWPVERELRFRHVVHYQVFDEFTHSSPAREGTRTNMGVVVARIIPKDL